MAHLLKDERKAVVPLDEVKTDIPEEDRIDYQNIEELFVRARQGWRGAQFALAHTYLYAEGGVHADAGKAFLLLQSAADRGLAVAEWFMGTLYDPQYIYFELDSSTFKDEKRAFELYKKSADQKFHLGCESVADCYHYGVGCERNNAIATKYAHQAARLGNVRAMIMYSHHCFSGDGLPSPDVKKGREWSLRAAELGSAAGFHNLGICYLYGVSCKKEMTKAIAMLAHAASVNLIRSKVALARLHEDPSHGMVNPRRAFELYHEASSVFPSLMCQFNVGRCYLTGAGVAVNESAAAVFLSACSVRGHVKSMYVMAHMGERVDDKAETLLKLAYKYGCNVALFRLARICDSANERRKYIRLLRDMKLATLNTYNTPSLAEARDFLCVQCACGCGEIETPQGKPFRRCGGCKDYVYFSKECQKRHWFSMGHKLKCGKPLGKVEKALVQATELKERVRGATGGDCGPCESGDTEDSAGVDGRRGEVANRSFNLTGIFQKKAAKAGKDKKKGGNNHGSRGKGADAGAKSKKTMMAPYAILEECDANILADLLKAEPIDLRNDFCDYDPPREKDFPWRITTDIDPASPFHISTTKAPWFDSSWIVEDDQFGCVCSSCGGYHHAHDLVDDDDGDGVIDTRDDHEPVAKAKPSKKKSSAAYSTDYSRWDNLDTESE